MQDWYLDAVCQWEVILVRKNQLIIASFPYSQKRKLGFNYITMPLFVKWMGLYVTREYRNAKNEQKIMSLILPLLSEFDAFKQNFHPNFLNWSPLYWQGYLQTTYYTYQLDLTQSLVQIWANCNRNIKRNINKASSKLSIETNPSPDAFYEINQMSFDRQGVRIPYSLLLFLNHDKALQQHEKRLIICAKDEKGSIHAASYLIWDQMNCYYHLSGEDPSFRKSGAGILLVWEAIKYAKIELNLKRFDFEGSMMPKVAHIRQQFGAAAIPYHYLWKYNNTVYKFMDALRSN
ncbi:MAG: GNAT family N-acetyltransferase [Bacteroidota bacterium]